ncbi:MAG: glucosaminidase domain-containing protein [Candidatus Diapherotrites archaeon]|nr:glucosaminidase domain-containing protein [Candidatus Diapherotrites archaeon]
MQRKRKQQAQNRITRRKLLGKAIGYGTAVGAMAYGIKWLDRRYPRREKQMKKNPEKKSAKPVYSNSDMRIQHGKPSMHIVKINTVLQNTPLKEQGKHIHELARKYNIDPAFALAFFRKESKFGALGLGAKNKNPGNLRKPNSKTGFQKFDSWEKGIEAWFKLIANGSHYYKKGRYTIEEIVPIYAPPSENLTRKYISDIKEFVQEHRGIK